MSSDKTIMKTCANLILTLAIENFAHEHNIPLGEARNRILMSKACESLYNFTSQLWMEGPDYFLAFYDTIEKKQQATAEALNTERDTSFS